MLNTIVIILSHEDIVAVGTVKTQIGAHFEKKVDTDHRRKTRSAKDFVVISIVCNGNVHIPANIEVAIFGG